MIKAYITFLAALLFFVVPAGATPSPGVQPGAVIVAVVNDEAITSYDVDSRMRFVMATTKMADTQDVRDHIRPQVVRTLIDERLELQEAKKNDLSVTDKDIDEAIRNIEAQRNMPAGTIDKIMETGHVPKDTFRQQVRAQLLWRKLIAQKIRPDVHVSEEEIEIAKRKVVAPSAIKQEFQIEVLGLPVDKPSHENEVHALADKLVSQVRAGASFEEVARQLGSSGGSRIDKFWINPSELDPVVARALAHAKAGTLTEPLRSSTGYTIIKVYDTRALEAPKDQQVDLKEILLKVKPDADIKEADSLLAIADEVAKHPGSCEDKSVAGIDNAADFDISTKMISGRISELPPALRVIAENLNVGDISTPLASYEGIRLYMLCGRKETQAKAPDPEQIKNQIMEQKLELAAQKYLRNLRREAFVEVKG